MNLVLASASPRRRELLSVLGFSFDVLPADIDETPLDHEGASEYLVRMASSKARAAKRLMPAINCSTLILASDTSVVVDGCVLGKPQDKSDFFRMMRMLSGRTHQVMTSVYGLSIDPLRALDEQLEGCVVSTEVSFKTLSDIEIEAYWGSGEPLDKAGGYGIQGKGAMFVEGIQGSYSNVVGLPLKETGELLQGFGFDIWAAGK